MLISIATPTTTTTTTTTTAAAATTTTATTTTTIATSAYHYYCYYIWPTTASAITTSATTAITASTTTVAITIDLNAVTLLYCTPKLTRNHCKPSATKGDSYRVSHKARIPARILFGHVMKHQRQLLSIGLIWSRRLEHNLAGNESAKCKNLKEADILTFWYGLSVGATLFGVNFVWLRFGPHNYLCQNKGLPNFIYYSYRFMHKILEKGNPKYFSDLYIRNMRKEKLFHFDLTQEHLD